MNKVSDYCVKIAGEEISLPRLSAVTVREGKWFVISCPELGIASQGLSKSHALLMLQEAVGLWLRNASVTEIRRSLKRRGEVKPLELSMKNIVASTPVRSITRSAVIQRPRMKNKAVAHA